VKNFVRSVISLSLFFFHETFDITFLFYFICKVLLKKREFMSSSPDSHFVNGSGGCLLAIIQFMKQNKLP